MTESKHQRHLAVDEPILNSPFEEPTSYWVYDSATGMPIKAPGRRSAHYYFRSRRRQDSSQTSFFAEEEMVELELVNYIREQIKKWRISGYKNVTPITKQLLNHWSKPDRGQKLFFAQIEAVETLIWLKEIHKSGTLGIAVPEDEPNEEEFKALNRYCLKMATGSGKTLVMAMIIAWNILNKVHNRQAKWCTDRILVLAPNLTVKERLGGSGKGSKTDRALIPGAKGNYYETFDLVPVHLLEKLGQGRILITNWHQLAEVDDSKKRSIIQRGVESPEAFVNRVLRDLGSAKNIVVLNDEAHHAWRPAPIDESDPKTEKLSAKEKKEKEEATVWVSGLDRINLSRGINYVVDMSATPFYIHGSGYPEGSPLPWIVSDFGLVDAIECGVVKIPQVPVDSDSGRPRPEYFEMWKWINEKLPQAERATARRGPKPESVVREMDSALQQLAGQWKEKLEEFQKNGVDVPPVMIVVCDNTKLSEYVFEHISGERIENYKDSKGKKRKKTVYGTGRVFPEYFSNTKEKRNTIRIDSKLLADAELRDDGVSKQDAAEKLREIISTVGKKGQPGEQVRCVVSVSMLTEGWDAQNVTQILGVRAFLSQLLCEQVVGRGLRRTQYDDFSVPEYVDVYGIPFEVIPVKKKPAGPTPPPPPTTLIQSLKERDHLEIEFPRVEGFVYKVKNKITADIPNIEPIEINPAVAPTETIVRARVGYQVGNLSQIAPGGTRKQTREEFYKSVRYQQILFEISRRITMNLLNLTDFKMNARQLLFPQVLKIVSAYCLPLESGGRVEYNSINKVEIGLDNYVQTIVDRISTAIRPDEESGETPLLPRLERFRPIGSTKEVLFRTSRKTRQTTKSHISHVVLDTRKWESSVAYQLEQIDDVVSFARNDHLGFAIGYEFSGSQHNYLPDFILKMKDNRTIVLEVKGYEDEQTREKHEAAKRWCDAVTAWGKIGRWDFIVCKNPVKLKEQLN